jgi:hypothetical protein
MSGFQRLSLIRVTALEKGEKVFSVEVTGARYIDTSATRQKRREEYVHPNVHWRAILVFASLFSLLQTHDTRKANTQPTDCFTVIDQR